MGPTQSTGMPLKLRKFAMTAISTSTRRLLVLAVLAGTFLVRAATGEAAPPDLRARVAALIAESDGER